MVFNLKININLKKEFFDKENLNILIEYLNTRDILKISKEKMCLNNSEQLLNHRNRSDIAILHFFKIKMNLKKFNIFSETKTIKNSMHKT